MDEVVLLLIFACILIFVIIIFPAFTKDNQPIDTIPINRMGPNSNSVGGYTSETHALASLQKLKDAKAAAAASNSKDKKGSASAFYSSQSLLSADPVDANIMLDSYYISAREVPEDYPVKNIGDCPYTKAASTDLPMANMSLCGINKTQDSRLRSTAFLM
jgi:hypothetical protein